jgi:hypothetical protein
MTTPDERETVVDRTTYRTQLVLPTTANTALGFSCCELLVWEAGSWGRKQFGNPEEGKCQPFEAATKEQLVKTVTDWKD